MADALRWYLVLTAIGAAGLLPAVRAFAGLRSRGVLYARPLGLLVVAEAAWLASAVGGVRYGLPLLLSATAVLWAWSAAIAWRDPAIVRAVWSQRRTLLAGEAVGVVVFALATLARAQAPDAWATEKPMDLMILASLARARELPPADAWLGGAELAYYHLGHVMVDVVRRLSGVPLGVAFTFAVPTAAAHAGVAVFGLAGDLAALAPLRRRASAAIGGAVAVLSLLALATLQGGVEVLAANGVGPGGLWRAFGVAGFPGAGGAIDGVPAEFWWWWRATRVLPETITEFPAFSVLLGDVHAHLLALPLGALAVALAAGAFGGRTSLAWRSWLRQPSALAVAVLLFAGLAMTNPWDTVIYGALWGAAAIAAVVAVGWPWHVAPLLAARYMALPAGLALALAWPLLDTLETPWRGVGLVTGAASDPWRFAVVWLPAAAPLAAAAALLRPVARARTFGIAVAVGAGGVLLWALAALVRGEAGALADRAAGWYTLAALVAAFAVLAAAAARAVRAGDRAAGSAWGLAAAACIVVLATELVFVGDLFENRLNTVFKFWFATWQLLAIAGGVAVALAWDRWSGRVRVALAAVIAAAGVVYGVALLYAPAMAVARGREGQQTGIDALAYLERSDPGLAATARWAAGTLAPGDVLLEAVSADYGDGNLLSAASGVPTLLGWHGHEEQWRGTIAELAERELAVKQIYVAGAGDEAGAIARRYGVTHVYVGRQEALQFGADVGARFAGWPTVFEAHGVRVVTVPPARDGGK